MGNSETISLNLSEPIVSPRFFKRMFGRAHESRTSHLNVGRYSGRRGTDPSRTAPGKHSFYIPLRRLRKCVSGKDYKRMEPTLILSDYSLPTFDGLSALAMRQAANALIFPLSSYPAPWAEEIAIETLKRAAPRTMSSNTGCLDSCRPYFEPSAKPMNGPNIDWPKSKLNNFIPNSIWPTSNCSKRTTRHWQGGRASWTYAIKERKAIVGA